MNKHPGGRVRWWTFGGGAGNRSLAVLLELKLGERVSPGNHFITFTGGTAESVQKIRQAIDSLAARSPLDSWIQLSGLASRGSNHAFRLR